MRFNGKDYGMRDSEIDGVAVYCPNADPILGKMEASPGDFITCHDSRDGSHIYGAGMARVLGRVKYAAGFDCSDGKGGVEHVKEVKDSILALVLASDGASMYVRWIKPADVTRIGPPPSAMAAFFFAESMPYNPVDMLRLSQHGTLANCYVGRHAERVEGFHKSDKLRRR